MVHPVLSVKKPCLTGLVHIRWGSSWRPCRSSCETWWVAWEGYIFMKNSYEFACIPFHSSIFFHICLFVGGFWWFTVEYGVDVELCEIGKGFEGKKSGSGGGGHKDDTELWGVWMRTHNHRGKWFHRILRTAQTKGEKRDWLDVSTWLNGRYDDEANGWLIINLITVVGKKGNEL